MIHSTTWSYFWAYSSPSSGRLISHLSFAVEAQDLKADAGSPSSLDLVKMSEEVESRSSTSVVQLTLCQHTQQSGFAWVHIPQYSDP